MTLAYCALLLGQWCYPAGHAYICGPPSTPPTLGQRCTSAELILIGSLSNPRFPDELSLTGVIDLQLERVLRSPVSLRDSLAKGKLLKLPILVKPVLPIKTMHHVVFCGVADGKIEPVFSKEVSSEALIAYIRAIDALANGGQADKLRFYARHFDAADSAVTLDALEELRRAAPHAFALAPKVLSIDKLRAFAADTRNPAWYRGFAAFLMSSFGNSSDARMIRALIDDRSREGAAMLDSLLLAYIQLRPLEGWALASNLATRDSSLLRRFDAIRVYRFMYDWKPRESREEMLRAFRTLIHQKNMLDVPVDQLRRWKVWDLTDEILASYDRPDLDSSINRRMILRYALSCPLPQARQFVERERRRDHELVGEIEEMLDLKRN